MADPMIKALLGDEDTAAVVEPAVAAVTPPEPNAMSDDDGVLAAHRRRQAEWEKDAAHIFRGPNEEERRRQQLLADLAEIDARNSAERRRIEREKFEAEERASAAARIVDLRNEAKVLRARARDMEAEAARLDKLAKE